MSEFELEAPVAEEMLDRVICNNSWQPDGRHYQMASVGTVKRSTARQVS